MSDPPPALPVFVAGAMLHHPKVWPADVTVADLRDAFVDGRVHTALIVARETLLAVVTRPDIAACPNDEPARQYGRLSGRVVKPDADLTQVWVRMTRERTRRLAVIDHDDALLGLLCLKRSGRGFCGDADVDARAAERREVIESTALGTATPSCRPATSGGRKSFRWSAVLAFIKIPSEPEQAPTTPLPPPHAPAEKPTAPDAGEHLGSRGRVERWMR